MPYELFHARFPEVGERESRSVILLEKDNAYQLLPADYGFMEMFCNEAGCDCRRVFFCVISSKTKKIEAVICYGWETRGFYRKWWGRGTEEDIDEMQGPALNFSSPQGKCAEGILQLFKDVLLRDKDYIERVKRHYRMFRATVDKPVNPLLRRRRTGG
jgi:hypothetical protein